MAFFLSQLCYPFCLWYFFPYCLYFRQSESCSAHLVSIHRSTMEQLQRQGSTSKLDHADKEMSSPTLSPNARRSMHHSSLNNSNGNALHKSSSYNHIAHMSKSPRLMSNSESASSFATPPRDRSPSPYIPERDVTRDELMGVLMAFRACDPDDLTSKVREMVIDHDLNFILILFDCSYI